jgi:hypothetical protein
MEMPQIINSQLHHTVMYAKQLNPKSATCRKFRPLKESLRNKNKGKAIPVTGREGP